MERDGFVRFSIATAFERGPDAYPKFRVGVFLRMKITGDILHVQLLNKTYIPFDLDANDPKSFERLFAAMVDLLETSFTKRTDDHPSIGFALAGAQSEQA